MTTTIMRQSIVGDAWIQEMMRLNPPQMVIGADGKPNGNLLTGPVRLAFCDALFEPKPMMRSDPNSAKKYNTAILFPPGVVMDLFWAEYYRIAAAEFAQHWNGQQYVGIDNPIRDQAEKSGQFAGFTPGAVFMTVASNYKPPIVDSRNNPIVDPSKVYAGVWAIVAVNGFASGKGKPRKGPRFGLQTIMLIGDDTPLTGGAPDPKQQFAGVNVKPPLVVPTAAFGQAAPPSAPPSTAPYMPPQGYSPGGMTPPPLAPPAAWAPPPPAVVDEYDDSSMI